MAQIPVSDTNLLTPSDYTKVRMEMFEKLGTGEYKVRYEAALTFLQIAEGNVIGGADTDFNTLGKLQPMIEALQANAPQNNLNGVLAPTVTDDAASGYEVFSFWLDTVLKKAYICFAATVGAAVWVDITASGVQLALLGWDFDDATALVDPTDGFVNFDNSDLSLATEGRFSNITELPFDAELILADSEGKNVLVVQEDDATKFIAFTVDNVIDETTYQRLQFTLIDSGATFDDGATLMTTFIAGSSSATSGGHTIQDENDVSKAQETILKYDGEVIAEVGKTTIVPKLDKNNDYDPTGVQAGDVISRNVLNDGYEPNATAPFTDLLKSSDANISSDGIISTFMPAGYRIASLIITEDSGNAAGNISIGTAASGTQIVNAETVGANADLIAPLVADYFSKVNDTDLYVSSSAWGSGAISLYFNFMKV